MKALILAAGMGKRLMPLTKDRPKSMVEFMGRTLFDHTLDALTRKNVSEIIIVVGYCKDKVMEYLGDDYKGAKITYVYNDDYDKTNNIYSLKLGLEKIDDDLILCEGDIVFEPEMLDVIEKDPAKNLVFVSEYKPFMSGTVVTFDESTRRITGLVAKADQEETFDYRNAYKTVNVYYLTKDFLKNKFRPALDQYLAGSDMSAYYELLLGALLRKDEKDLYAHDVKDAKWFEIDDANDLEMAEELFSDDKLRFIDKLYGGYWRYDFLDFCFLYNAYFPSENFYAKASHDLPRLISNYPSGQEKICKLLASWYKEDSFHPGNLTASNGASELIRIINKTLVEKLTIPTPTFNEYENKLVPEKINYFELPANKGFQFVKEDYVRSVKESGSNVALIINPNNPTGGIVEKSDIVWVLENLKDVILIVDESFIDFSGDRTRYSAQDQVDKYPHLVVIRSISKEFGVPGLRLGYMLTANKEVRQKVDEYLPIWNINAVAEYFVENFGDYERAYNESIKRIIEDREDLYEELAKIDYLEALPSHANFILCKVRGSAGELKRKLFNEHRILVKDCSNKKLLEHDNYVRFAVRSKEDNDRLVTALHQIRP